MITSLQNPRIKQIQALLGRARTRRKEGLIVLEGLRLIQDAIASGQQVECLLYTEDHAENPIIQHLNAETLLISAEVMRHISDTQQPQGMIALFAFPTRTLPHQPHSVLILDAIRDPGNMGTILRSAAAAGAEAVLLSPDCVDAYNPKSLRAGMGAHFRIAVSTMTWDEISAYCAGLHIYLADGYGDATYTAVNWTHPWALIIGSEAHGAGENARQLAQTRIAIPMAAETESINAALAAGIILFEARRQRQSNE